MMLARQSGRAVVWSGASSSCLCILLSLPGGRERSRDPGIVSGEAVIIATLERPVLL